MRVFLLLGLIYIGFSSIVTAQEQQDFVVEAFISNETPYVGEQVLYGFRYYAYTVPAQLRDELPEFEGFWLSDVYESIGGRIATIDNRQYVVSEVYAEIAPISEGEITITPSVLHVPATVFADAIDLESEAITINVRPLPEEAPETFNGAVGQFNMTTSLDQTQLTLGQPVTLTMSVDGTGNLEQLPAPDLPDAFGWRIFANPPRYINSDIGGLRFGQKVFEWLLIPEQTGTMEFPEITFTFFDPQLEEYRSIESSAFTIEVFPGADNARALPTADALAANVALPLKAVPATLHTSTGRPSPIFWLLWVFAPLIAITTGGWVLFRQYQTRRKLHYRYTTALKRAVQQIRAVQDVPTIKASLRLQEAIYGYFADKLGVTRQQVKTLDLEQILRDKPLEEPMISSVIACLIEAESGRFIPTELEADLTPLANKTIAILAAVDKAWGNLP